MAIITVVLVGLVSTAWFLGTRNPGEGDVASPESPGDTSSPEAYVAGLFAGDETSAENREEIIRTLPRMSWTKYENTVGGAFEVLQWLYELRPYTLAELPFILQATEGLDGAFAELYAAIVYDLWVAYGRDLIRVMSTLPAEQVRELSGFLAYHASYHSLEETRALYAEYLSAPDLTPEEQRVLEQMTEAIDDFPG